MEVILKKCKITSSILNQTVSTAYSEEFKDWESLGWVVYGKEKWIIFHKEGILRRVLYNYSIACKEDWEQVASKDGGWDRLKFYEVTICRTQRNNSTVKFSTEEKANTYIEEYNSILKEAKSKGQFYI